MGVALLFMMSQAGIDDAGNFRKLHQTELAGVKCL